MIVNEKKKKKRKKVYYNTQRLTIDRPSQDSFKDKEGCSIFNYQSTAKIISEQKHNIRQISNKSLI